MKKLFYILLLLSIPRFIQAQCFTSPGNPIGGNINMGIMDKHLLRLSGFYKHSYSGRYFFGDELYTKKEGTTFKSAVYNYLGWTFAYGVTDKFTAETEFGYFINKTREFVSPERGYGFSNAIFLGKYNLFFHEEKRIEITLGAGGKVPMRHQAQEVNGIILAPEAQSSAGAYGMVLKSYLIKEYPFTAWRFFLISQFDYNFPSTPDYYDKKKYIFGHALTNSFFITKHLHMPPKLAWLSENWTVILQIRNEWKGKNQLQSTDVENPEWTDVPNSGSNVTFISPQLNYTIEEKWNISFTWDIPVYQYYNKKQMATDYAFNFNITRDLKVK